MGIETEWIDAIVLRRRIHTHNTSSVANTTNYAGMLDLVRRHHRRRQSSERPKD
jgi:hypothetical protein